VPDQRDHYQAYYQDKLWNLLPAIYRTLDTDSFATPGPLREIVNRIGAQAAILRRSIDRLWEDQSIETCDDWVISYYADLLATNLVASLDARGQRLDVANTVYFRRRKGTVSILEEIAAAITGWDARVVEFFRRLGRTRHNFDPEIGIPSATDDSAGKLGLQLEEGLVGFWTHTAIGGYADLRNRYGATKSTSAFDEYFHTADFRRGVDMVGWHNIPRLGVFLWRLYSFGVDQSTPVEMTACPGQFTFDPTGRQIQLFAAASRTRSASYGDQWISPNEWQLPGPIAAPLMEAALKDPGTIPLYAAIDPSDGVTILPNSLGIFTKPLTEYALLPIGQFIDPGIKRSTLFPEIGRFRPVSPPAGEPLFVTYHYGFSSTIGAGPYDRRIPGVPTTTPPAPVDPVLGGGSVAIKVQTPAGTTRIADSLTYTTLINATDISDSRVEAAPLKRPVLRLPAPSPAVSEWVLTGANDSSQLSLEGLLISGGDIILRGTFATVTLTCCTLDPGNAGSTAPFARSVDGRDLRPTRVWIEGDIITLTIDRCICGPIRVRGSGNLIAFIATDSIIQGIRTSGFDVFTVDDIEDPVGLARVVRDPSTLSGFLRGLLDAPTKAALAAWDGVSVPDSTLLNGLLVGLNAAVGGPSVYHPDRFTGVQLSPETQALLSSHPTGTDLTRLNRLLLEEAYPEALGQPALALATGTANLSRCTVLGRAFVHRIHASECILDDFSVAEDTQNGCVRFTTCTAGSVLPRQYESARVPARGALFVSREFADSGYGQLLPTANRAVLAPADATILEGAEDGSEMGAFAREKNATKERSLLIKYQEFMPLGLVPVVIHIT
jgi:hypothetical protein